MASITVRSAAAGAQFVAARAVSKTLGGLIPFVSAFVAERLNRQPDSGVFDRGDPPPVPPARLSPRDPQIPPLGLPPPLASLRSAVPPLIALRAIGGARSRGRRAPAEVTCASRVGLGSAWRSGSARRRTVCATPRACETRRPELESRRLRAKRNGRRVTDRAPGIAKPAHHDALRDTRRGAGPRRNRLIEEGLPETARTALLVIRDYHHGTQPLADVVNARVACWHFVDAASDPSHAAAVRAVICALYPTDGEDLYGTLLLFADFLASAGVPTPAVEQELRTCFLELATAV